MNGPDKIDELKQVGHESAYSGETVIHNDDGLVIHPKTQTSSRSDGHTLDDEPNYDLDVSFRTGMVGTNPWRDK